MAQMMTQERQADERLNDPRLAPPGQMFRQVQDSHGLKQVSDAISIKTIDKSNAAIGKRIVAGLKDCMMVSKRIFGKVSSFASVFTGLRRILGGL
jgi:hypothetical protein